MKVIVKVYPDAFEARTTMHKLVLKLVSQGLTHTADWPELSVKMRVTTFYFVAEGREHHRALIKAAHKKTGLPFDVVYHRTSDTAKWLKLEQEIKAHES